MQVGQKKNGCDGKHHTPLRTMILYRMNIFKST